MTCSVSAQNRLLKYADKQFGLENYAHAAEVYTQAYQKKQAYATARKAAQAFTILHAYDQSFAWWEKVISAEEAERNDYAEYIQAALKLGKIDQVNRILKQSGFDESDFPELDFDLIQQLEKGNPSLALLPMDQLNSTSSDHGFRLGKEGRQFFASDRGESLPTQKKGIRLDAKSNLPSSDKSSFNDRPFFQLYQADTSGRVQGLQSDLEDAAHISDFSLMESQGLVFYTVVRDIRKIKKKRAYSIHPEVYFGSLGTDGAITSSRAFPLNDFTTHGIQTPYVDKVNKRIYFASDMEGGNGGFDLYYVTYDENLRFGEAVNLGPGVNTAGDESHPFVVKDRLFFSSKGHPGLGGMDIFQATFDGGLVGNAQNLGVPFNSTRDDFAYYVSQAGIRYLSSDREGGMGSDDIYTVQELFKKLLAKVIDCDGMILTDSFDVELMQANTSQKLEITRSEKGEILADLEPGQNFLLHLSKPGYFIFRDSSLTTIGMDTDTLNREYHLRRVPYELPVWSDIVFYDLDRSQINPDAQPVLDRVAELMRRHDFVSLKVAAHTDARASDAYNQQLSENRANAILEYLVCKGIETSRVKLEWFGEAHLANDCADGAPCPDNLHQQNRRSELVLEAFADSNRQYEYPSGFDLEDPCDFSPLTDLFAKDLLSVPHIYFDFDKHDIRLHHQKDLDRVSFIMRNMSHLQLYLAGHTDQRGNEAYNMKLAERRAKAVMQYLVKSGIDAKRLQYEWFGKSKPVHDCSSQACTEAMHQENRRTELFLKGN